MKAINNQGIITIHQSVPHTLQTPTGTIMNAPALSDQELKEKGLFDLIIPNDYDNRIHNLGEIYFDSAAQCFRKDTKNKTWTKTLAELKEQAINNFKHRINYKLQTTDWYIIRNIDNGEDIPGEIQEARQELRNTSDTVEQEINALTSKAKVVTYDYPNID
jgi:hypothetical protein|tara:strand:+ start:1093 stop:1575 length:483 start_codon:yes stop_codon:yes gene_type:complete